MDPNAQRDTYVPLTLFVDNWRWAGVPFYVRTGKRLAKRVTEIAIQFKRAPLHLFQSGWRRGRAEPAHPADSARGGNLTEISVQATGLRNDAAAGLDGLQLWDEFRERSPSAYETLLLDAIVGDATLYTRQDMVEASWAVVEPIQNLWRSTHVRLPELRRGKLGTGGLGRNAGAARARLEAAVSTTVAPEKILKELSALWVEEGKLGASGVLRACTMTLVVIAEEADDAGALGETTAALMPEHPARAIMVRLRAGGERALSERVYQQCWKPFGQRQQICCEQIELTASDAALGDLPSVLLPLIVADLPVILWCRSPRLLDMPEFGEIAGMATKVVLDSAAFGDASDAIRRLADEQGRGRHVGDLAWTRLTRWREMLARVFENREYLARLNAISEVKVTWGPGFEAAAWYLAAWAQNALADAGVAAKVLVQRGEDSIRDRIGRPRIERDHAPRGGPAGGDCGRTVELHSPAGADGLPANARGTRRPAARHDL